MADRGLLEQDDIMTPARQGMRSGQPEQARADDDDLPVLVPAAVWRAVARAAGYQPRARHSAVCGRSAPSRVSLPWPG